MRTQSEEASARPKEVARSTEEEKQTNPHLERSTGFDGAVSEALAVSNRFRAGKSLPNSWRR
jgi:hypothetical protein